MSSLMWLCDRPREPRSLIAAAVALGFATTLSLATPWDGAREQEKVTSKFLRSDVHASIMAVAAVG